MKNVLSIICFVISASTFSQSQDLNGVNLNAPMGFIKTGDYLWEKGNDMILVASVGRKLSEKEIKASITVDTRGTTHIMLRNTFINGKNYPLSFNEGINGKLILMTGFNFENSFYTIVTGVEPNDYNGQEEYFAAALYNIEYMIARFLYF